MWCKLSSLKFFKINIIKSLGDTVILPSFSLPIFFFNNLSIIALATSSAVIFLSPGHFILFLPILSITSLKLIGLSPTVKVYVFPSISTCVGCTASISSSLKINTKPFIILQQNNKHNN